MLVDRILFPVHTLGPGNRVVIWTMGCHKNCLMCANPELRTFDQSKDLSLNTFSQLIESIGKEKIEGFTLSGGEPLCQSQELQRWIEYMKNISEDILLFTGYSMDELAKMDYSVQICLQEVAVYISGEYIHALNDNKTPLIASSNQDFVLVNDGFRDMYSNYLTLGRKIENIFYGNDVLSVGIHNSRG